MNKLSKCNKVRIDFLENIDETQQKPLEFERYRLSSHSFPSTLTRSIKYIVWCARVDQKLLQAILKRL